MSVRVVLVDDEQDARESLARRLERVDSLELLGAAADAAEAARLLERLRPDVVLLDLHRRSGEELDLCRVLAGLTAAPVIVLASFMTAARWEAARRAGAAGYLLKHVDTGGLGRQLAKIAGREGSPALHREGTRTGDGAS